MNLFKLFNLLCIAFDKFYIKYNINYFNEFDTKFVKMYVKSIIDYVLCNQ